jgi:tetratricopeptide (TPR) repeat protein
MSDTRPFPAFTIAPARTEITFDPAHGLAPPAPAPTARPLPRVDGYDVLGEVGQGGMGVVYKALHLRLKRVVALKMLYPSPGLSAGHWERLLARFRREAEALARLRHPHIVEVYDVGEAAGGAPYFALEFCSGGNLETRLGGKPLPPPQAGALVGTLARAVQAAHEAQVIHRDLKPANVLLAACGLVGPAKPQAAELVPKITDFGLARKLDEASQTHTGDVFGTPSYMAPEQARGQSHEAGPAADTYALGAVLYECLTGRPPFKAATSADTLMQVLHEEPIPPRKLEPGVPRDLETIALKCLQKEPHKRYATAGALADDLARYLRGDAIHARPVGAVERVGRWARQRPAVAGLLAALAVLTAVALVTTTALYRDAVAQARQARAERDEADRQRQRAERNLDLARQAVDECFLVARDAPLLQQENMRQVRKLLFEKAVPFYRGFRAQRPDDADLKGRMAEHQLRLAYLTAETGRPSEALAQYRAALDLYRELAARQPGAALQFHLVDALNGLGWRLAELGQTKEARACFEEALRVQGQLAAKFPRAAEYRQGLAQIRSNLAALSAQQGRRTEALALYRDAHDRLRAQAADRPNDLACRSRLALVAGNLASLYADLGRWQEALAVGREAIDLYRQLVIAHPGLGELHKELARVCVNRGVLLMDLGRSQEAEKSLREALASARQLVQRFPEVTEYRRLLAAACTNLAKLYHTHEHHREALAFSREALALLRELLARDPDGVTFRFNVGVADDLQGLALRGLGRRKEAMESHRRARGVFTRLVRESPGVDTYRNELARTCAHLALALRDLEQFPEALANHRRALELRTELTTRNPEVIAYRYDLALTHRWTAELLRDTGRPKEALQGHYEARRLLRKLVAEHPTDARYQAELARVLARLLEDHPTDARYQAELARVLARLLEDHPQVEGFRAELASVVNNRANLQRAAGQRQEALTGFRQARDMILGLVARFPKVLAYRAALAQVCVNLAQTQAELGEAKEALTAYAEASDQLLKLTTSPGGRLYARGLADVLRARGELLARTGQHREAAREADGLAQFPDPTPYLLYNLACVFALAAAEANRDPTRPLAEREWLARRHAAEAVRLLQRVRVAGFFREPANLKQLDEDSALDGLRQSEDYRAFRAAVERGDKET